MEKWLEKLFDFKEIPTKFILVVWATSALLLFSPTNLISKLNLADFNSEYGKYFGIAFLVCSAFLLITIFNYIVSSVSQKRKRAKNKLTIINAIYNLDPHEKAILREFGLQNKNSLQLPLDNETVNGLANTGVICQVSTYGYVFPHGNYITYSISDQAQTLLTPDLIGLPQNLTENDKQQLLNDRPQWVKHRL